MVACDHTICLDIVDVCNSTDAHSPCLPEAKVAPFHLLTGNGILRGVKGTMLIWPLADTFTRMERHSHSHKTRLALPQWSRPFLGILGTNSVRVARGLANIKSEDQGSLEVLETNLVQVARDRTSIQAEDRESLDDLCSSVSSDHSSSDSGFSLSRHRTYLLLRVSVCSAI